MKNLLKIINIIGPWKSSIIGTIVIIIAIKVIMNFLSFAEFSRVEFEWMAQPDLNDDSGSSYDDYRNMRRIDNEIYKYSLLNYSNPQYYSYNKTIKSIIVFEVIDCDALSVRPLSFELYAESMGEGELLNTRNPSVKPTLITLDMNEYSIMKGLCDLSPKEFEILKNDKV